MTVNVDGFKKFQAGFAAAVQAGTDRAAEQVLDLAQQLCPVDSGDLKGSGRVGRSTRAGGGAGSIAGRVGTVGQVAQSSVIFGGGDITYAQYVEYGNGNPNYPAQPFLGPALKRINVQREIKRELKNLERRCKVKR